MTGADIAQIILALGTFITASTAAYLSLRNAVKIEQVHLATNSMKDALVAAEKNVSFREGQDDGKATAEAAPEKAAKKK